MGDKVEATFHGGSRRCLVCGKKDGEKPMAMRGMPWCSERHRKVIREEVQPSKREIVTMSADLFEVLRKKWGL